MFNNRIIGDCRTRYAEKRDSRRSIIVVMP
jgi:hypothetical protein